MRTIGIEYIHFLKEHSDDALKRDPNFKAWLEGWQTIFEELLPAISKEQKEANADGSTDHSDVFSFVHTLSNHRKITFSWNIPLARRWLNENRWSVQNVDVFPLRRYLTKSQLEQSFSDQVSELPIIVFPSLGFGGRLCVMDGIPQVLYALEQKQKSISGYVLLHEEHRNWIANDNMRYFYEFLCDHMLFIIELDAKKKGGRAARNMWRKTFLSKHMNKFS